MTLVRASGFICIIVTLLSPTILTANGKPQQNEVPKVLKQYVPSSENNTVKEGGLHPCVCAIFFGSQLDKNVGPPKGDPVLQHTHDAPCLPKGPVGIKICTNKCMEMAAKHLHNSKEILCAVVDRDIDCEKAYLFVKNCEDKWVNTNLSSGKEYSCKDGSPVPCQSTVASLLSKRRA